MQYGSACKHMYYLSNENNFLVVENPMEYTVKPTTYPGLLSLSNATEWAPDHSSMRREISGTAVDEQSHLNRRSHTGGPSKKQ
jgi:hypothetical protein